ncbi:unnamed protein product [marine sediment metagenome]|uniref:Uncharacterized protein n=1 Tax=marine sediment metagenome TaxID=412755 RepID=X1GJ26_9ZZZZ
MKTYIKKVLKPTTVEQNKYHKDIIYKIYKIKATDLPDDKEIEIVVENRDDNILVTTNKKPF